MSEATSDNVWPITSWFRRFLLPGFVFQSIIIAGGYGTGRELVEFFLRFGPAGGLLAMLLPATILVSVTCLVSFELARISGSYDYRTFFQHLLGRAWFLYELGYFVAVLLILAVIGSAAGSFLTETFGIPYWVGVVGLLIAIGFLVFKGSTTIEKALAGWSFVLYAMYIAFFVWSFRSFGSDITSNLAEGTVEPGWVLSGLRYGALQVSLVPAMLFATRHIKTRTEAVTAGVLAGPIAIIPGILFYVAMVGQYPGVLERPIPANFLLELLGSRTFQITFQVVLFGTLIETGTGLIHAFNERIASVFAAQNREMPSLLRPTTAVALLIMGSLLSKFGLVELIAVGYGALTWVFMAIFVVPLLTVGIVRIRRMSRSVAAEGG